MTLSWLDKEAKGVCDSLKCQMQQAQMGFLMLPLTPTEKLFNLVASDTDICLCQWQLPNVLEFSSRISRTSRHLCISVTYILKITSRIPTEYQVQSGSGVSLAYILYHCVKYFSFLMYFLLLPSVL